MVPTTQFSQGPDVNRRCEGCADSTVIGVQATRPRNVVQFQTFMA